MKKSRLIALIVLLLACFCFPGFSETPIHLTYHTIGTPDADLALVNQRLNELLIDKIGVTVSYIKVDWNEYEAYLNGLIASGKPFDVAFAMKYALHAQKGAFLGLTELLQHEGKETYDLVHPTFWRGVTIDGEIYGVPTNKELAVLDQWMYPRELIEKYGIDITQYTTLESLAPLFEMIYQNEPEYLVMELDRDSNNFFALYGYEYVVDKSLPLVVKSLGGELMIHNAFELPECRQFLDVLRAYYKAGYTNKDAALYRGSSLAHEKKVFFRIASGGPYSETIWSQLRGYEIVAMPVTEAVVTTEATRGGVMSISASTRYPEKCMELINLINTDPEVRNLLNFGIEGIHYTLSEAGQVLFAKDLGYSGVQYTQGNWFILRTQGGANPEPLDKWEQYKRYNEEAVVSDTLGFTPDLSPYAGELAQIANVFNQYYPSLMTGSVDVDIYLPRFNEALRKAGLDSVREGLQAQLDAWLGRERR